MVNRFQTMFANAQLVLEYSYNLVDEVTGIWVKEAPAVYEWEDEDTPMLLRLADRHHKAVQAAKTQKYIEEFDNKQKALSYGR